jgi:hypothetical protein
LKKDKRDNFNVSKFMDVNNCIKEDYFNFENKEIKSQMSLKLTTPLDKNFRIHKQSDKFKFSGKDIIYFKNKQLKMTNSVVFYLNHFYKKEPYFKFLTYTSLPNTVI